jgi:hypothetical protein
VVLVGRKQRGRSIQAERMAGIKETGGAGTMEVEVDHEHP